MSKKLPEQNQNKQDSFNEVKSDFLVSLTVTIAFAILPGIIQNLDLPPFASITIMVISGCVAITIIYLVFKYPNNEIVKKLTFDLKITDKRARLIFTFLIIFIVSASSYIFYNRHILTSEQSTSRRSFLDTKSNNTNLSSELSKLVSFIDSSGINKNEFNKYIKQILEDGHEKIKEQYNLKDEDLKISIWKKIYKDSICYVYEQNWTGSEVDKCFLCSNKSLIGCASLKVHNDIFMLYRPDYEKDAKCAWSIDNDKVAEWDIRTSKLVFDDNSECEFNSIKGDYNRTGLLCFYSSHNNGHSELGICLDFNTTKSKIYFEEKIKTIVLDMVQSIMIIPDKLYTVSEYNRLKSRVKNQCEQQ